MTTPHDAHDAPATDAAPDGSSAPQRGGETPTATEPTSTHDAPADDAPGGDGPGGDAPGGGAPGDTTHTDVVEVDLDALAAADPRTKGEVLAELDAVERQRDEYLDDLRRSHADFENYRKRVLREGGVQREQGKADVAAALLDVLDDLDRTLDAAASSSDEGLAKGVTLVADKLVGALRGVGLERIDATGVVFDPTQHEAVQEQPAAEPRDEPVVQATLRPGYRLGDRVLRAAMVVVEQ